MTEVRGDVDRDVRGEVRANIYERRYGLDLATSYSFKVFANSTTFLGNFSNIGRLPRDLVCFST